MLENILISPDAVCKDAPPMETVGKIKDILAKHGIETEEVWGASDVPCCYSLRINIAGTSVGANGKGVNKEYALASGYGELMERLQLGLIWRDKLKVENGASSCEAQSRVVPAQMLLERNPGWYDAYAAQLKKSTGLDVTGQDILKQYTNADGTVRVTPYYNMTTHTWEYLPTALCKAVYATNGGAAGNTMEEAMVQAISEIVERHYKMKIIQEDVAVPQIPEEVLRAHTIEYGIISFLRENGYRVVVKDCSLGADFPVVCVCITDTETGRYHTHFGAYPNFDVALQRTLTETFQGRNIKNITRHEDLFCNHELLDLRYQMVELRKGTCEKSPQFFCRTSAQPYRKPTGLHGETNRDRLKKCIAFFREQGYDVLVRDSSTLGFPTCQIVVPGYSEALPQRLSDQFNDGRYGAIASAVLRNPAAADQEAIVGLMMHIVQSKKLKLTGLEDFATEAGLPAELSSGEDSYYMSAAMAHVSYTLGKNKDAIAYINKAIRANPSGNVEYLICVKRWLTMKQSDYSPEEIRSTLEFFHTPETIADFYSCIGEGKNPLDGVVLRCDLKCARDCPLHGRCKKKRCDELVELTVQKAKEVDQSGLEQLLQSI